jgi:hypothetical protein
MINCEARNAERKNRTKNSTLEYKKKITMRRVNEEDYFQREITELNRLKQNKNRKYSWPGQLAVYSQTIEVTSYLTTPSLNYLGNKMLDHFMVTSTSIYAIWF